MRQIGKTYVNSDRTNNHTMYQLFFKETFIIFIHFEIKNQTLDILALIIDNLCNLNLNFKLIISQKYDRNPLFYLSSKYWNLTR